jgi:methanogenic corrinoid protein MtbC1
VKVIVGGATLTDEVAKQIGADYRAKDAVDGISMCQTWVAERKPYE